MKKTLWINLLFIVAVGIYSYINNLSVIPEISIMLLMVVILYIHKMRNKMYFYMPTVLYGLSIGIRQIFADKYTLDYIPTVGAYIKAWENIMAMFMIITFAIWYIYTELSVYRETKALVLIATDMNNVRTKRVQANESAMFCAWLLSCIAVLTCLFYFSLYRQSVLIVFLLVLYTVEYVCYHLLIINDIRKQREYILEKEKVDVCE